MKYHRLYEIVPEFVDEIPGLDTEPGKLYIRIGEKYTFLKHLCACGCGGQAVMQLGTPEEHGWTMIYDGSHISIHPSIGMTNHECQSHYFIEKNKILWLRPFSSDPSIFDFAVLGNTIQDKVDHR